MATHTPIRGNSHERLRHPVRSVKGMAESLRSLNQQAMREYTSVVENILRSPSRDARHIENTLDGGGAYRVSAIAFWWTASPTSAAIGDVNSVQGLGPRDKRAKQVGLDTLHDTKSKIA